MNAEQTEQTDVVVTPAKHGRERRLPAVSAVGGLPTVSLLPRELRAAARERVLRRVFLGGVLVAVVVAGLATAGASAISGAAQTRLDAANARTQTLVAQLGRFRDVQLLQQDIAVGNAAVEVASSTEIDWQQQLAIITAEMPADFVITSLQTDSASVYADFGQGSTPLDKPRAATIQMSLTATDVSVLPRWLYRLRSTPAYANATASVSAGDESEYTVLVTIDLSAAALVNAKEPTE
jgi:hypothetical protein